MASQPTPAPVPAQAPDEEASGRERAGYVLRHSKRWIIALILLALAVAVAAMSLAVFTSSSANPATQTTGGILTQDNSKEGAAILEALKMVPGESEVGTVTIENTGDVEGEFSLSDSELVDTPGPNGGNLSEVLQLTVVDDTTGATVYDGDFAAMGTEVIDGVAGAGTPWDPGESHDFTFTVSFPDAGQPASDTTEDNAYQGSETTVTYNWNAVSVAD